MTDIREARLPDVGEARTFLPTQPVSSEAHWVESVLVSTDDLAAID
jgi:hypothetical protein